MLKGPLASRVRWECGIFGALLQRHPPRQLGGFNGLDGLEQWRTSRHAGLRGSQGSLEELSQDSAAPSSLDEGWLARRLPLGERGGMHGRNSPDTLSGAGPPLSEQKSALASEEHVFYATRPAPTGPVSPWPALALILRIQSLV